jgi:hypothetical protein
MTLITGSLAAFGAGLSTAAAEEVLPEAKVRGRPVSCAASAQQAAKRKNCFARVLKLPLVRGAFELFMECELPMLVYPLPILPKTRAERVPKSGSIFEYA